MQQHQNQTHAAEFQRIPHFFKRISGAVKRYYFLKYRYAEISEISQSSQSHTQEGTLTHIRRTSYTPTAPRHSHLRHRLSFRSHKTQFSLCSLLPPSTSSRTLKFSSVTALLFYNRMAHNSIIEWFQAGDNGAHSRTAIDCPIFLPGNIVCNQLAD